MVRTQVQLTEAQAERLRRLAADRGVSLAALIREAVEILLAERGPVSSDERRRRIMSYAGRYSSGRSDVAAKHDEYLAEDLRDW